MTAHERDKVVALLKSVAAPCTSGPTEHAWRKCRHCLAVAELDHRDVRSLLGDFITDATATEAAAAAAADPRRI